MRHFTSLWNKACREAEPDPHGAAGELMAALGQLLDVEQVEVAQFESQACFLFDLSSLGFKGMDHNVVMVAHAPVNDQEAQRQAELLEGQKLASSAEGFCFQVLLCQQIPAANPFLPSSLEVVSLAGEELERLFASRAPHFVLFEVIRRQVSLQKLCPYNTTQEARGAMFRGRRVELAHLEDDLQTDFAVIGARRIGKTSLLKRACQVLRRRAEFRERAIYFNCLSWGSADDCFHRLAHRVDPKKEPRIQLGGRRNAAYMLERRSRRGARPLLLFFDELDRVVDEDSENGWPFFSVLAEAVGERWARVVFAGYRSMSWLMTDKASRHSGSHARADTPFHGRLKDLSMEPLSRKEIQGLICDPFRSLGIPIRQEELVLERIWDATKGYPFLTQFYGERLFRFASERSPQEVYLEDVDRLEDDDFSLNDFLIAHLLENTIDRGSPVAAERLCAYTYAHHGNGKEWSDGDFLRECERERRRFSFRYVEGVDRVLELRQALRNLVHAGILSFRNGKYSLTFPLLGPILRRSYPDPRTFLG